VKPKTKDTAKPKPTISKGKPPTSKGKVAKATKPKSSKPKPPAAKPTAGLAFDTEKYDKVKALLVQLSDKDLHNLWLSVYGYREEVTEKHVPEDNDRLIAELADAAYELNPTPEQMTPKGLGDLLDAL
jgi:hypothetical protein